MADNTNRKPELVAQVAAAYFSNSHVSVADIPLVMSTIAAGLGEDLAAASPAGPAEEAAPERAKRVTPAEIRASIRDEGLTSFEDGKAYKMLKRHLSLRGLTPQQYREKWGLPVTYPMTAPGYSARRSAMAKKIGLGGRVVSGRKPRRKGPAGPTSR
jgi:predicted transcriptional regulator